MNILAASRAAGAGGGALRSTVAPTGRGRRGGGGFISGPAGALLARPWFDRPALWGISRALFPLSRAWAAASVAEGALERFAAELPASRIAPGAERAVRRALDEIARDRGALGGAEQAWDVAFFGELGPAVCAPAEAHHRWRLANHALMRGRFRFSPLLLRQRIPSVRFAIPSPASLGERYAALPASAEEFHALPAVLPPVRQSRPLAGTRGREYWLRFASPNPHVPGEAWAHVFEPADADPATMPTFIEIHGVAVETDSLSGWQDLRPLAERGIRLVRLSAPWHNRRRLSGTYGGEPFFAGQPVSGLELFRSLVVELAVLVGWARARGTGRVAFGGTSMGALASQLAASHASHWPAALRPDVLFLATTSRDMNELCFDSTLSRALGVPDALAAAGWRREEIARWTFLAEPLATVPLAPRDIIMLLGRRDTVTPFPAGLGLARAWRVPEENLFCRDQGHFSATVGLLRNPAPYERLADRLSRP